MTRLHGKRQLSLLLASRKRSVSQATRPAGLSSPRSSFRQAGSGTGVIDFDDSVARVLTVVQGASALQARNFKRTVLAQVHAQLDLQVKVRQPRYAPRP